MSIRSTAEMLRNKNQNWSSSAVLSIIVMCYRLEILATDPKDYIFAYLGLWKPASFEPNYNTTLRQAHAAFVRHTIEETKSLDVLSSCYLLAGTCGDKDASSWVPNWTTNYGETPIWIEKLESGLVNFYASKNRLHQMGYCDGSADARMLHVRGKIIDTISALSQPIITSEVASSFKFSKRIENAVKMLGTSTTDCLRIVAACAGYVETIERFINYYPGGLAAAIALTNDPMNDEMRKMWEDCWDTGMEFPLMMREISDISASKNFGRTETGTLRLFTLMSSARGSVALLHGSRMPILLREAGDTATYQVVGACYVEGLMFGEAVNWDEDAADDIFLV